eukprot:GILI01011355.1.p1 GENE.GILI01011355.1~~GILI01011355.1.p1  ORF type:complete len:415 (+),score=65.77 GILI01011355.1:45-1289(+)
MPSIGTQMYWHQAEEPLPPWDSEEQKAHTINLSRQLRNTNISPFQGKWLVGNRKEDLRVARKTLYEDRRRLLAPKRPKITAEPLLSSRTALNTLFSSLDVRPMQPKECAELVKAASEKMTQSDFPMVVCIQAMAASRGLETRVLTREEIKHRRGTFFPNDLPPGERALVICSKVEAQFVALYTEWLPTNRLVGKSLRRGHLGSMRLLCPTQQPLPWHKRVRSLRRIDKDETVCIYLATNTAVKAIDAEREVAETIRAAQERSAQQQEESKSLRKGASKQEATVVPETASEGSEEDEEEEFDMDEDSEEDDWNDAEEESIMRAVIAEDRKTHGKDPKLQFMAWPKMVEVVQLETTAAAEDPFGALPPVSAVVMAAVRGATKNIHTRSTATWTQRLLLVRHRRTLYSFAQQLNMGE